MAIDPRTDYVHLTGTGTATTLPGGERFWSLPPADLDRLGTGWLVSEFEFTADWSNWEMHPAADELVYVLAGDVEFVFDGPEGPRHQRVQGRGLVVVPRGTWHTAIVHTTSRVLHVTMGAGTTHRPVDRPLRSVASNGAATLPTPGVVLFVADVERLTTFYREVAAMVLVHRDDSHAVLEGNGLQLVIHALYGDPDHARSQAGDAGPAAVREDAYVKLCLPVPELAAARARVARLGGALAAPEREWQARGFRACDGHDPEGNVFQLREPAPQ